MWHVSVLQVRGVSWADDSERNLCLSLIFTLRAEGRVLTGLHDGEDADRSLARKRISRSTEADGGECGV